MSSNRAINRKLVILGSSIIAIIFVSFNWFALEPSEFIDAAEHGIDFYSIIATGAYPVLDLTLIIPSFIVLFRATQKLSAFYSMVSFFAILIDKLNSR